MAIGDFFSGLGQRVGRGLTAVGGYDPMQQVSPEEAERRRQEGMQALQRSLGRATAILSGDPQRLALAEEQTQRAEAEKKEYELNKKLDDAIDKSNLPQSQKDLLKSLNIQTKAQTLMQAYEPTKEDIPVDIKKLNELRLLRSKFDENSPNYDPTYTKEKYKQEASILGVSSTLFDPSKEKFITDYMKTIATQYKDPLGKPQYTQEEARSMAESMYESVYGNDIPTPKNLDKSEDVINLGTLNEID
jgi:hypothetical protein